MKAVSLLRKLFSTQLQLVACWSISSRCCIRHYMKWSPGHLFVYLSLSCDILGVISTSTFLFGTFSECSSTDVVCTLDLLSQAFWGAQCSSRGDKWRKDLKRNFLQWNKMPSRKECGPPSSKSDKENMFWTSLTNIPHTTVSSKDATLLSSEFWNVGNCFLRALRMLQIFFSQCKVIRVHLVIKWRRWEHDSHGQSQMHKYGFRTAVAVTPVPYRSVPKLLKMKWHQPILSNLLPSVLEIA